MAYPEKIVGKFYQLKFLYSVWRRKHGVPIAYLTGQKEFFGLNFWVNRHTLIPRPETEIMIEKIIEHCVGSKNSPTIFDIGTGSGCIAITLAKKFSNANVFASDVSEGALRVAQKNAKKHNTKIEFKKGSLLLPCISILKSNTSKNIIITANLPYLTKKQFNAEKSIQAEPKTALIGDDRDGLDLYRDLLKQLRGVQIPSRLQLYLEIDPDQTNLVPEMIASFYPNAKIEIYPDLCGLSRIVRVQI